MPEIAIITSMYNAEDTIVETIHSVVNQSYENWEWFIMDDGSSDASRKLVLENTSHESRIHYINCGRIGHIGVLRNRGSKIASAPYLNFLDADDQLLPGFLDKQITLMRKSCAAVAHTHANIINAGEVGKIPLRYTGPNICQPPEMFKHLKHQNPIFSPSVVLGADAFKRCGRFSENKYHFSNLDGNLWLRMARDQTFVFHPEPLINYRLSPGSLSRSRSNIRKNCRGNLISLEDAVEKNSDLRKDYVDSIRYRLGKEYAFFAKILLDEENPDLDEVRSYIRRSFKVGYRWRPFFIYQFVDLFGLSFPKKYHVLKNLVRDFVFPFHE